MSDDTKKGAGPDDRFKRPAADAPGAATSTSPDPAEKNADTAAAADERADLKAEDAQADAVVVEARTTGRNVEEVAAEHGMVPEPRAASSSETEAEGADKRDAERRRDGRRVTERSSETVRAAIRTELEGDRGAPSPASAPKREQRTEPVIALDHVFLAFDSPILEDVSFAAKQGETICIVGESGTGKSTTLKLILRLLVPDKGRVLINGKDITDLSFKDALAVRQRMGMVFQGAALFDSMSVFENIAYPLREHTDLNEDEIEQRVREKLQFVDLDPDRVMEQLPSELSGGMRKRVGIARGMADNPEIMLYDEPTSGLDPLTIGTITRLIMKLQRELNVTSVVVSHDIRSVFRMATRVAVLHDRQIVFFGTPEEMAASDDKYLSDFLGGF